MSEWWASLRHGGMLLTPQRVLDFSSSRLDPLSGWLRDRLRGDVLRLADDDGPSASSGRAEQPRLQQ